MKNKPRLSILSLLKGDFFSKRKNVRYIPFLFFIVFLILLNIRISFRAERLLKESISLEQAVVDFRLEYITTKSDLMSMYRRSVIEEIVADKGLKTSLTPPFIIKKNND